MFHFLSLAPLALVVAAVYVYKMSQRHTLPVFQGIEFLHRVMSLPHLKKCNSSSFPLRPPLSLLCSSFPSLRWQERTQGAATNKHTSNLTGNRACTPRDIFTRIECLSRPSAVRSEARWRRRACGRCRGKQSAASDLSSCGGAEVSASEQWKVMPPDALLS